MENQKATIDWLIERNDLDLAADLTRVLARVLPKGDPGSTDFLAHSFFRSKAYDDAAAASMLTVRLVPESADALLNAAKCFVKAGRPEEAAMLLESALERRPRWLDARIELAVALNFQGRHREAEKILGKLYRSVPVDDPNHRTLRFNLAWHQMSRGKFKESLEALRSARELEFWGSKAPPIPLPELSRGSSLKGKTILIVGEGGAGDEIIGARFGRVIQQKGGRAVWLSRQGLASVFSRTPGIESALDSERLGLSDGMKFDYWAPCMDLPYLLELGFRELPSEPYLHAHSEYVGKWKEKLSCTGSGRKLKVGLRWAGNPKYETDLMRTVPLSELSNLFGIPGVQFYSLQKDEGSERLPKGSGVVDLGPELANWEETVGVVANLDLVISSCTSVAHLAAAMGKPTWVLPPLMCYYIWALPGDSSPWYPSVRLFRQERFGSWKEPAEKMCAALSILAK